MSISSSLSIALSGLTAASRAAELVSSNVSNSMTEGYARRELQLSPRFTGGIGAGVKVDGVSRVVDEVVLRERRLAEAGVGLAGTGTDFYENLLRLLGEPGEAGSLTDIQADFEASLIEAVSRPDSESRLADVLSNAKALSGKLNMIGDGIHDEAEGVHVGQQRGDVLEGDPRRGEVGDVAEVGAEPAGVARHRARLRRAGDRASDACPSCGVGAGWPDRTGWAGARRIERPCHRAPRSPAHGARRGGRPGLPDELAAHGCAALAP